MTRKLLVGALAGAWVLVAVGTAQAGPVTFQYEGTVSTVTGPTGWLPSGIAPGDDFLLSYTFESTTPESPASISDLTFGYYFQADGIFSSYSVVVGGNTFAFSPSSTDAAIFVYDDYSFGSSFDRYYASAGMQDAYGYEFIDATISMMDASLTAISGLALPTTAPDPADFDGTSYIGLRGFDPRSGSYFNVFALDPQVAQIVAVPEPSSILVFAAGLAALGGIGWLRTGRGSVRKGAGARV
jgi:hypothetical protein